MQGVNTKYFRVDRVVFMPPKVSSSKGEERAKIVWQFLYPVPDSVLANCKGFPCWVKTEVLRESVRAREWQKIKRRFDFKPVRQDCIALLDLYGFKLKNYGSKAAVFSLLNNQQSQKPPSALYNALLTLSGRCSYYFSSSVFSEQGSMINIAIPTQEKDKGKKRKGA
jgi:hypothetical protein